MSKSSKMQTALRSEGAAQISITPSGADIRELAPVLVMMCDHHLGNFVLSLPTIQRLSASFRHGIDGNFVH